MKLPKERALNLAASVVVRLVCLQYLVHALEHECPELSEWAVIEFEVARVSRIVMVGSDSAGAVYLTRILDMVDLCQSVERTSINSVQYARRRESAFSMMAGVRSVEGNRRRALQSLWKFARSRGCRPDVAGRSSSSSSDGQASLSETSTAPSSSSSRVISYATVS